MTDPVAQDLAALTLDRGPAPEEARHEAARRLLDVYSLSTASGADRAVHIAKSLAEPRNDPSGVSIWGEPGRYDLSGAVLANSVATRYRDMNDSYFNRESLHPSDMVPALWGWPSSPAPPCGSSSTPSASPTTSPSACPTRGAPPRVGPTT